MAMAFQNGFAAGLANARRVRGWALGASLLLASAGAALAQGNPFQALVSPDVAAARVPVEQYLKGHATGDASFIRQAFLPTARIEGVRDGKLRSWTVDDYAAGFKGTPPANERERSRTIDLINVAGGAAVARATLVIDANTTIVDYFVLLKVDGEWKIANKVYSANVK